MSNYTYKQYIRGFLKDLYRISFGLEDVPKLIAKYEKEYPYREDLMKDFNEIRNEYENQKRGVKTNERKR